MWISEAHKNEKSKDSEMMARLRLQCENAKIKLSTQYGTNISSSTSCGKNLTREEFEKICKDLFQKAMEPLEEVFRDAKMAKSQINEVVLIGGSTQIPNLQETLSSRLFNMELNRNINPEAVAFGAAILAASLSGDKSEQIQDILPLDVIPYSIGIENSKRHIDLVMRKNTVIPNKSVMKLSIGSDKPIRVFENDKYFIGEFKLSDLNVLDEKHLEIAFNIDVNGVLEVFNNKNENGRRIRIESKLEKISNDEIGRMIYESGKFRDVDEEAQKKRMEE